MFGRTLNGLHDINADQITSNIFTGITLNNLENEVLAQGQVILNTGITTTNLQTQINTIGVSIASLGTSTNNNLAYQTLYNSNLLTNLSISFLNERNYDISRESYLQGEINAIITAGVSAGNVD